MNEPAQRCEEQIISLFQDRETQVWQGWILKKMGGHLCVYPLYYKYSQGNIPDNIRKCEEISHRSGLDCVFRIVEHTNYHLSSILTDNGYVLKECGVVGEWNIMEDAGNLYAPRKTQDSLFLRNGAEGENAEYVMADADTVIGIKRQELLFLPDGNLPFVDIENILRFSVDNGVTRILADIPGKEELPEQYGRAGFHRAYLYRCYQKEEKSSKEQED
ncbi:MAG: hypothetical protein K2M22_04365 [Lachnospiraceae bacterium]|nr:hypothetical protein [Lachnospiraceae bacterium]MDE7179504.1 hypothetical protein [Lachnospiraceae bacterium]